jgi:hypothetical protein
VLFESTLGDDRWVGHAEDYVLVAASAADAEPRLGLPASLENAIGRVRLDRVDPASPGRLVGTLLGLDRPDRLPLPVAAPPDAVPARPIVPARPSVGVPLGGTSG